MRTTVALRCSLCGGPCSDGSGVCRPCENGESQWHPDEVVGIPTDTETYYALTTGATLVETAPTLAAMKAVLADIFTPDGEGTVGAGCRACCGHFASRRESLGQAARRRRPSSRQIPRGAH